jgi:outer membrane receptor protein involved in Fe transport
MRLSTVGPIALLLIAAATPSAAQLTTGTIEGTITDETGATLPGAEVRVTNVDTGIVRTLVTDEHGRFQAATLQVGTYEVGAVLSGFASVVRKGLALTVGRTLVADLVLPLAAVQQELVVTADAPLIETTSATVASLIDEKKVQDLPLLNRDLTQLTYLQPGVVKSPAGQGIFSGMGDKFTVAGARGTQNLYLLDGVSNSDSSGNPQGASGDYVGAETIQEIQIVTNNYSAEYRSAAGGIVSAVTKSGTNVLHGSAFEFFRNDTLDAINYFDEKEGTPKEDFQRNQFGGSIGGPISRNRMFFFASYEGLRSSSHGTGDARVPSLEARQGRLPGGRVVPIEPSVLPFLNLYPVPGQGNQILDDFGDGTVRLAGPSETRTVNDFIVGKLDHQLNVQNTLSGTYNWDQGKRSPFGFMGELGALGSRSRKHVFSAKWTSVVSNASVNELHFGYSDTKPEGDIPLSTFDFAGQGLTFVPGRRMGEIVIPQIASIGYRVETSRDGQRTYTAKDGYSLTRGNHSFRLGGEWTYYMFDAGACSRGCNGVYDFASYEQFLRGIPRRFEVLMPGGDVIFRDMRQHMLGAYFQDNWRAREDLTLNLGLRYEFASTISEVDDKISNLVHPDDTDVTVGVFYDNPTAKSFSPRIGFVWAPGEAQTSLRGGFGIFYEHPGLFNVRAATQELPPFKLVGRIDRADANRVGQEINFPNAFSTQLELAQGRPNIRTFEYDLAQTYIYRWSLTLQRQFWGNWVGTADYTGSRGLHLWQQSLPNINRWEGWPEQPAPDTPKFFPAGSTLIYPQFGETRIQYANANSYYNGGSLGIQKRLSAGFQFQAQFTYQKTTDQASGVTSGGEELPGGTQRGIYAWDVHLKKGLSSYHIKKAFTANLSYELPWGRDRTGAAGLLARGWQVNGILTIMDGYPFSLTDPSTAQDVRIGDNEGLRVDLVPGGDSNPIVGDPDRYYDVTQFAPSRLGYFGTLGRNTLLSPGLATMDLSVFKNTEMGIGRLQLRVEVFNLFNRANFGTPDTTPFAPTGELDADAARITSTRTPGRRAQLGVRWIF